VRLRTCENRALIVKDDNLFNNHRADFVAVAMPRVLGDADLIEGIDVYVEKTDIVEATINLAHQYWLATEPNTDGNNGMRVIHFDRRSNGTEFGQDYATKWAACRVPSMRGVEPRGRLMFKDGEIIRGFKPEDFVYAMRSHHWAASFSPSTSNEDYMRQYAERAVTANGVTVRTDSAENFLEDVHELGDFEWIKREIEVS
jgi:hypothetical protein